MPQTPTSGSAAESEHPDLPITSHPPLEKRNVGTLGGDLRPHQDLHDLSTRVVAAVVSMTLVVLVVGGWWVSQQGYVSWFGTVCTDEGYDPVPSYDELVTKYKKSPHCARRIRDETWF